MIWQKWQQFIELIISVILFGYFICLFPLHVFHTVLHSNRSAQSSTIILSTVVIANTKFVRRSSVRPIEERVGQTFKIGSLAMRKFACWPVENRTSHRMTQRLSDKCRDDWLCVESSILMFVRQPRLRMAMPNVIIQIGVTTLIIHSKINGRPMTIFLCIRWMSSARHRLSFRFGRSFKVKQKRKYLWQVE